MHSHTGLWSLGAPSAIFLSQVSMLRWTPVPVFVACRCTCQWRALKVHSRWAWCWKLQLLHPQAVASLQSHTQPSKLKGPDEKMSDRKPQFIQAHLSNKGEYHWHPWKCHVVVGSRYCSWGTKYSSGCRPCSVGPRIRFNFTRNLTIGSGAFDTINFLSEYGWLRLSFETSGIDALQFRGREIQRIWDCEYCSSAMLAVVGIWEKESKRLFVLKSVMTSNNSSCWRVLWHPTVLHPEECYDIQ